MLYHETLSIAICDDSETDSNNLQAIVEEYLSEKQEKYKLTLFRKGAELLESEERFDILFLDVELGDSNGIDLMHKLETTVKVWRMFITTSHEYYINDSFGIRTSGFLHKPVRKAEFAHFMDYVLNEYRNTNNRIISFDAKHNIPLKDVLSLSSEGSYINVFTVYDSFVVSYSAKTLLQRINSPLIVQTSKGQFVNIANVTNYNNSTITVGKDNYVQLSRKYREDFMKLIAIYLRDMIT